MNGGSGNDVLTVGPGGETISGGLGSDSITGGAGNDVLYGFGPQDLAPDSGRIDVHQLPINVNTPVFVGAPPGDTSHLLVAGINGDINIVDLATDHLLGTPFLKIPASDLGSGGERGLEGMAFDPNYAANGQFYVSVATPSGAFEVWQYTRSATDPNRADPASKTLILSIDHPNNQHYAGWLGFGPDGYLYVATGDNDEGPVATNPAGDPNSLLGKILRIDVHHDDFPADPSRNYAIPHDNPFVGVDGADEVWALGLRNPWRDSFDAAGNLYIGDVGENAQEEVNVIRAGSPGGENFGWATREGTLGPSDPSFTDGGLVYDHGTGPTQGDCVVGGYVYAGPGGAQGLYIFGDFVTPNLWAATFTEGQATSVINLDSSLKFDGPQLNGLVTSFGVDGAGALYATTVYGSVFRITPSAAAGDGNDLLSGGAGDDKLYGGAGDDILLGGPGVDTLSGGLGADVLDGGGQADILTGGDGADRFVVSTTPTGAAQVTDFTLGADKLDLNALLGRAGVTGVDPVADGFVTVASDGAGGSNIYFDADGRSPGAAVVVADLQHIAPTSSNAANALAQYDPNVAVVTTSASAYVAPDGVFRITLSGSQQTVSGNNAGDVVISNNTGNRLIGGAGADLFQLGRGGDVATGGAGADVFSFAETPWVGGHITDFAPGEDTIDLSGLLARAGYTGSNPQADGYVKIDAAPSGDARIWSNLDGVNAGSGWWLVTTLDGLPPSKVQMQGDTIVGADQTTGPPAPPLGQEGESLQGSTTATLGASAGWTGAATLSNHALAVVTSQNGGYGSHVATEQSYDASGNPTASASLLGYAPSGQTFTPQIATLPAGGFYEVTYAGSSDYEIYNAAGQRAFVHNQYTSQTPAFSPLISGGYLVTDSAANVFGLFDANTNNVGWFSMPSDARGTPTVNALDGGGFVFTYAGTAHFDAFDASGNLLIQGDFSASGSQFAAGFAALPGAGNGFAEAWLSPDGGQNGLATSLDLQLMGPRGMITPAITVAQDLDPWHTQFKLQAHDDGSVAILWSQGGGVFGAEYGNGATTGPFAAVAGDLSAMDVVLLSNNQVGLAYLQNGDVWAELFDPATGAVQRADLGASSGGLSTVRALATANGGMAVSWHTGGGVQAASLSASGQLSSSVTLAGDLLGVDGSGHAVTLHDVGGTPVLQTYVLNDTLFWVH
ncbi:MAG: hypothetical protein JWO72_1321 [Caulobacteraceae bacterium]|nr:hypothetical protein [Caulobacteraceae bacterium]